MTTVQTKSELTDCTERPFTSKVLLFGEYSVILGSMALSLPYPLFAGRLKFTANKKSANDRELQSFGQYLKVLKSQNDLGCDLDTSSFLFDVGQGLSFVSTIPQGFGVGSSGALCSSVYSRYCREKTDHIEELKNIFAQMESHFHGASSGIDPLISYLQSPVLINENGQLQKLQQLQRNNQGSTLFLLNTGRVRKTEPLVNLFLEKCKNDEFKKSCREELGPFTNSCIKNFLDNDSIELFKNFKKLSVWQYEHLRPMIPKLFEKIWLEGIETNKYYLKLCGSGGGGFLLGLTNNFDQLMQRFDALELRQL